MSVSKTKVTIMYIYLILEKFSDENHMLTAARISELLLNHYNVSMERKAVYRNINELINMGFDIATFAENGKGYYLRGKKLELADIRILCDAVASSDMITEKESKEIIKKLTSTLSIHEQRIIEKTIYVKNATSEAGKKIFYNVDQLMIAINRGAMVSAKILMLNLDKKFVETGEEITFSPYTTVWSEGKYYVICKEYAHEELMHIRIDRITDIKILERNAEYLYGGLNVYEYTKTKIENDGEYAEKIVICISEAVWEDAVEAFASITAISKDKNGLRVSIYDTTEKVVSWIVTHYKEVVDIENKHVIDMINERLEMLAIRN